MQPEGDAGSVSCSRPIYDLLKINSVQHLSQPQFYLIYKYIAITYLDDVFSQP